MKLNARTDLHVHLLPGVARVEVQGGAPDVQPLLQDPQGEVQRGGGLHARAQGHQGVVQQNSLEQALNKIKYVYLFNIPKERSGVQFSKYGQIRY